MPKLYNMHDTYSILHDIHTQKLPFLKLISRRGQSTARERSARDTLYHNYYRLVRGANELYCTVVSGLGLGLARRE